MRAFDNGGASWQTGNIVSSLGGSVTLSLYYGFRYYYSNLGRFLGRDPMEEAGGLHLYAFCGNNGVNRWDYLGHTDAPDYWVQDVSQGFDKSGNEIFESWEHDHGVDRDLMTWVRYKADSNGFVRSAAISLNGSGMVGEDGSAAVAADMASQAAASDAASDFCDISATIAANAPDPVAKTAVSPPSVVAPNGALATYSVAQDPVTHEWLAPVPSDGITTANAYVNGITGTLARHAALGALHVPSGVTEFTLVNIPTRGIWGDILRVAGDKLGITSDAAKFAGGLEASVQASGTDVAWVAHSGGAEAFAEGMRYEMSMGVTSLSHNSVTFDGGANNAWATNTIARSEGVNTRYYNSSFDAVANIVGTNGNPLQMATSLLASPLLFSNRPGWSPHTAPSSFWGWQYR